MVSVHLKAHPYDESQRGVSALHAGGIYSAYIPYTRAWAGGADMLPYDRPHARSLRVARRRNECIFQRL